ncbi:sensor histidine kinase [Chryseobacterium lineare]
MNRNCLILTQYRDGDTYNDFIGKFYHFPANDNKNYLSQFNNLPIEFIYYEPSKGKGEFYGYGKIIKPPFEDKREPGHYFVEVEEYKPFSSPVSYKDRDGNIIEKQYSSETYNSQNAVRRTTSKFIDEICLDGGILLNFKADAHLIKILGEQLIGSEKVGILELIKNSIDAGASYCKIRMEKLIELPEINSLEYEFNEFPGPVIVIEDDGKGMDWHTIENGWLRPASTLKTNIKEKLRIEKEKAEKEGKLGSYNTIVTQLKKENGGRIPLGEKGVGRFATHRLGRKLIIRTKTKDVPYEYVLSVDWDEFDKLDKQHNNLDSIGVKLTRQDPVRNYGEKESGTQIIIYGGRDGFTLDRNKIEDINKSILRLNSPNPSPNQVKSIFKASLVCPQIPDLEKDEVYEKFIPNFSLDALINSEGVIEEYSMTFNPPKSVPLPQEEWKDKNYDLKLPNPYWRDDSGNIRTPVCGSFFIHLDAWYRVKPWIDGPDAKLMLEYLSDYGGISIYRDDIIIFPAESGAKNDWIHLSQRHIKQGFRMSYYNMIGNIEIEQSENLDLIDKTNREGMIENKAFKDLAELTETLIQNIIEPRYIAKRDEYTNLTKGIIRDPKKLADAAKSSSLIVEGIKDNYPIEDDPWHILHQLGKTVDERKEGLVNLDNSLKNLKKSITIIEDVQERLVEHAGFGIAAAVSLHELAKITANFYSGISELIKSGNVDKFKLEDLQSASASLKSELKRLSPLRAIRNENRREFYVSQSIKYAYEVFRSKMKQSQIEFEFNIDEDFQVYARYSTLNQILANLFDNSIHWLNLANKPNKKILIRLSSKYRALVFADNGPGIDNVIRPYLFEPGYSMKIPPSGLGLYISKSYMHSMNGDIHETHNREKIEELNGAQFTLEFDTVPKSKELAK